MTWAMVMYIFRWHPETLASSLRSSMVYMYVEYEYLAGFGTIADFNLVMVIRTIGILCAHFWCITSELGLTFGCVRAYRAVICLVFRVDVHSDLVSKSILYYETGFLCIFFSLRYIHIYTPDFKPLGMDFYFRFSARPCRFMLTDLLSR
jgi:hypothetical protein